MKTAWPPLSDDEIQSVIRWRMRGPGAYPVHRRGKHWVADGVEGKHRTRDDAIIAHERRIMVLIARGGDALAARVAKEMA